MSLMADARDAGWDDRRREARRVSPRLRESTLVGKLAFAPEHTPWTHLGDLVSYRAKYGSDSDRG